MSNQALETLRFTMLRPYCVRCASLLVYKTRFSELGFAKVAPGLWRIIALEDGCAVGPHYARKDELLADLTRYAIEYGCSA